MEPTCRNSPELLALQISDADGAAKHSVPLRRQLTLVGTRPGCGIRLRSSRVSPVHCAIVRTGNQAVLRDLASSTGTSVNDWETDACALAAGDRIQIRRWQLIVEAAQPDVDDRDDQKNHSEEVGTPRDVHTVPATQRIELRDADGKSLLKTEHPLVLIGRHERCDLELDDNQMSRVHVLLFHTAEGWAVADLLSTNGTRVNDRLVDPHAPEGGTVALNDGDVLHAGASSLTVRIGSDERIQDSRGAASHLSEPCESAPEPLGRDGSHSTGIDTVTGLEQPAGGSPPSDTAIAVVYEQARALRARSVEVEHLAKEIKEREETLLARYDALEEHERSVRERIVKLERDERHHAKLTTELEATLAKLQERSSEIEELRRECECKKEELEARSVELASTEQDLAGRADQIARTEQRLDEQRAELDRLSEASATVQKQQAALSDRNRALEEAGEKLQADQATLTGATEELRGREQALQDGLAEVEGRARRVDELQRELSDRQAKIVAGEEDLAHRMATATKAVDLCKRRARELDAREAKAKALEKRLHEEETIQEDVMHTLAERERGAKRAEGALADQERRLQRKEAALEERENALNDRQAQVESIARQATTGLEQLAQERQDFDHQRQALKDHENDSAGRTQALADRERRQHETAVVIQNIAASLDKLNGQLSDQEQVLQQREAKLDTGWKRLLVQSLERVPHPVSPTVRVGERGGK